MCQEEAIKDPVHRRELNHKMILHVHEYETASVSYTYTLFDLEFKVAKDKLVSSSYKYDYKKLIKQEIITF